MTQRYEGIWVGEASPIPNTRGIRNEVVAALKRARLPALRWPGGCFADEYHWMDGIGPREKRPTMINIHWGGVTENNHFGTHEFFDLCEQLGCEPSTMTPRCCPPISIVTITTWASSRSPRSAPRPRATRPAPRNRGWSLSTQRTAGQKTIARTSL